MAFDKTVQFNRILTLHFILEFQSKSNDMSKEKLLFIWQSYMDWEPTRIITRAKCTATHKFKHIETIPELTDTIQFIKPIKRGYKSCKTKTSCFDWE